MWILCLGILCGCFCNTLRAWIDIDQEDIVSLKIGYVVDRYGKNELFPRIDSGQNTKGRIKKTMIQCPSRENTKCLPPSFYCLEARSENQFWARDGQSPDSSGVLELRLTTKASLSLACESNILQCVKVCSLKYSAKPRCVGILTYLHPSTPRCSSHEPKYFDTVWLHYPLLRLVT